MTRPQAREGAQVLKLLADENFHNHIWRGVRRQLPDLDFQRAQDIPEISGAEDPVLLEWTARNQRVLLTHDVNTIHRFVLERMTKNQDGPGVIFVPQPFSLGQVIDDLVLISTCCTLEELTARAFTYLPLA